MFDNPQQEVKNMSKKLRPVKLSDEAFELFYKEIYAEFGPKDVPPVELNPKKEVQIEEEIVVPDVLEEPEIIEAEPEIIAGEIDEADEIPEETEEFAEDDLAEESEDDVEEIAEEPEASTVDASLQEEMAQAAAMIRDVQDDEIIDEDTEGITLVKSKKEKGIGGLVFTICLELLAIAGIVGYWLVHIL